MLRGIFSLLLALTAITAVEPRPAPPAATPRRPLPFFYDIYTFRGAEHTTSVVAAFAVPVGQLEREHEDSQVQYRFDVTLVLADTALRTVNRRDDSVFVAVPRALDGDHLLFTHIQMQAPPSRSTLQRVIMNDETTPGIGQLYTSPFPIPDYSGDALMLSDIALGLPDAESGWKRGDVSLALLPTSQFPQSSFDLYYEIYNLPRGHPYTTDISVEPVDEAGELADDERNAVNTRFSGEAATRPDGTLGELRRVDASLEKGGYRMTVTVTDQRTGKAASRSREFRVRGWAPGVTMVPAHPRRRVSDPG